MDHIRISWIILIVALPALVQWLVVKPNEITFETPYIAHNIEFTLAGFKLDTIEERQYPAQPTLERDALQNNQNLLSEVRLWDWQALDAVYKQFQEIRLYYEFVDVDIDRYQIGDRYRQSWSLHEKWPRRICRLRAKPSSISDSSTHMVTVTPSRRSVISPAVVYLICW